MLSGGVVFGLGCLFFNIWQKVIMRLAKIMQQLGHSGGRRSRSVEVQNAPAVVGIGAYEL